MNPTVVVLDGEQRAALAVVRSLGRRGCQVQVGSSVLHSTAGGSRHAAGEMLVPDPMTGSAAFADAVGRLCDRFQASVVVPVTEGSTLALLEHHDLLGRAQLPTSDLAHFQRASDKAAVLALAGQLGIDVPEQWVTGSDGQLPEPLATGMFPLVVKPSRSVVGPEGGRSKVGVTYAASPEELRRVLSSYPEEPQSFLLQRRVEGPGIGVFLLRWNGEILATFAHRRIREKPPSGGVSVNCESVALPPGLLERSEALLAALDWNGVAMIEYKQDTRTGRPYLMEINPRFWGSLQLAIDAGVDFPWLLLQAALGRPAPPVKSWRIGIRSRWWLGEIDHLIARLRHTREELALPADAPSLLNVAVSTLLPWRPRQRNDVFRIADPVPGLRETTAWLRALSS